MPSRLFPVVQSILMPLSGDYLLHPPLLEVCARWGANDASRIP